jgi:hypothetical protein
MPPRKDHKPVRSEWGPPRHFIRGGRVRQRLARQRSRALRRRSAIGRTSIRGKQQFAFVSQRIRQQSARNDKSSIKGPGRDHKSARCCNNPHYSARDVPLALHLYNAIVGRSLRARIVIAAKCLRSCIEARRIRYFRRSRVQPNLHAARRCEHPAAIAHRGER